MLTTQSIRKILNEWDPVGHPAEEKYNYDIYIKDIKEIVQSSPDTLEVFLKDLLENELGLDWDSDEERHAANCANKLRKLI